jgi:peptide/nickel transport system permease protein
MLRYALRRTLWAIPTLFGVSLVVFFVTTLIPDPAEDIALDYGAAILASDPFALDAVEEQRRSRFLDLPRFFNAEPRDVRSRAEAAVAHLVASDNEAPSAAHRLVRLGGAALPFVLPKLDNLPPAERGRVAVALAPIAERMGLRVARSEGGLRVPDQASLFWEHFWQDRSTDFTAPAIRRAVHRMVLRSTDLREQDIVQVDTFALDELVLAMGTTTDREALARLASAASHVTGRAVEIPVDADPLFARRALADWQEWWYVHRTDYVPLVGAERMAATVSETRYGKWVLRAVSGQLGISARDGEPIYDKLRARVPVTLGLTALAMLVSYALAVPLGVYSAVRRGRPVDTVLAVVLFAMYSLPTFWAAELLVRAFAGGGSLGIMPGDGMESHTGVIVGLSHVRDVALHLVLPVSALTLGSLASLSRYQRASMLDVIGQDYIRTARAKGVPVLRLVVVHALRNALMPTVTLAGLQLPVLFGGAFIVEEVFGLPGLGYETLRAVEAHDAAWLTATILVMAVITTVGLIASDVAYGALDPRVRDALLGRQRGSSA